MSKKYKYRLSSNELGVLFIFGLPILVYLLPIIIYIYTNDAYYLIGMLPSSVLSIFLIKKLNER